MTSDTKTPIVTMSISLPEELKEQVKLRTKQEHYGTPSDYIRSLIREDCKRSELAYLERMLLAGLVSGPSEAMTQEIWESLRADFKKQTKASI